MVHMAAHISDISLTHGKSPVHKDAMLTYLIRRRGKGLTQKLQEQEHIEINVLKHVDAVVKTLAERGLPFRGSHEVFGTSDN